MFERNGKKYKVLWDPIGFSYAKPIIYVEKKFIGIPFWVIASSFVGSTEPRYKVYDMNEVQLLRWFETALIEYLEIEENRFKRKTSVAEKHKRS
jgi:hypothetical protein